MNLSTANQSSSVCSAESKKLTPKKRYVTSDVPLETTQPPAKPKLAKKPQRVRPTRLFTFESARIFNGPPIRALRFAASFCFLSFHLQIKSATAKLKAKERDARYYRNNIKANPTKYKTLLAKNQERVRANPNQTEIEKNRKRVYRAKKKAREDALLQAGESNARKNGGKVSITYVSSLTTKGQITSK